MNAYEARELTKESQISGLYREIEEAARNGGYGLSVSHLTENEFKKLINDGYRIYVNYGTEQLTKYHEDLMHDYDDIVIDWEA